MAADVLDFEIQVPYKYTYDLSEKIFLIITQAEKKIGFKSGMIIEPKMPPLPTFELESNMVPKTAIIFVSVSELFVVTYIKKYIEEVTKELHMHSSIILNDPNKCFIEWLKKKIGLKTI